MSLILHLPSMVRLVALSVLLAFGAAALPAPALADDTLQEAQQTLQLLGLFAGRADGKPSDRTTAALQAFQRQNNLPVTGRLDDRTLTVLRQKQGQFQGQLGAAPERQPGGRPRDNAPESKPQAAPVGQVDAAPLSAPPGARPSTGPGAPPPALFSGGSAPPPPPIASGLGSQTTYARPSAAAMAAEPQASWRDWLWVLPFSGIPIFAGIWWYAVRRPVSPFAGMARPQRRREPHL